MTVAAGTYNVRVTPPAGSGFGSATALNQNLNADKSLDFVLVPAGSVTLSGRVLDSEGVGVGDQQVYLTPAGGTALPAVNTDGSGFYSFQVSPGDYTLRVASYNNNAYSPIPRHAPNYYEFYTQGPLTLAGSAVLDVQLPAKRVSVHDPPVTTALLSPPAGPSGEYPDPVTVTLSASASPDYTVAATYYSIDGGPTETYSAPFNVSGAGPHTIRYWSVDSGGVYEIARTQAFVISAGTDLSITKSVNDDSPVAGQNVAYTIVVSNLGTNTASDVLVTDHLPSGLAFVSCASDGGGVCGGSGNNRTVSFETLGPGSSATVTLVAALGCSVADGALVGNTATVASATNDTDVSNNSATAAATASDPPPSVQVPADIVVSLPPDSTDTSAPATFGVTASDNCPGVTVSTDYASGANFPVGTTTVTATATDSAGHTASATFKVSVRYNFAGFFQPVDNLPMLNVVNAGQAIPVKFSLSGYKGLSIFAAGYPASGVILCDASAPASLIEETVAAGGSSLTYDGGTDRYHYVWKTNKAWAGTCRQLVIRLRDGTERRANFMFR